MATTASQTSPIGFMEPVQFSGRPVVHYAAPDGNGNVFPACGQRIGAYALPWRPGPGKVVDCKKCGKL
ncbi:hypothetical protein [Mycolicibacterium komossense]|uniref:Uncharacterized protein n=1 Tax=Mycolicibacterium komossense TaxID=1779 RepID=A0ABT3C9D3_9MYCO|nr:hypothetical protein [Mycolicibacterium komossense]MCV7226077.1 hypothetical protein [Mycolicibacterium komossense]